VLSDSANCTVLRAVVLTQYRRVIDGQTDGIAVASTVFAMRAMRRVVKKLVSSNISSTCPHKMVNFGPLMTEIGWQVCGIPANFSGFYNAPQCLHCKHCTSYGNSVCLSVHPSVTRRYCVKTTARTTVQFALSDSKICLVL